jgi:hypothetical protein
VTVDVVMLGSNSESLTKASTLKEASSSGLKTWSSVERDVSEAPMIVTLKSSMSTLIWHDMVTAEPDNDGS